MTPCTRIMIDGDRRFRIVGKATVAAGFAKALLELAVSTGARRAQLVEQSGINPLLLDDQDARVPFETYVALMRVGQALSGDAALALHFGEAFDMDELSIVGLIGAAAKTMADALVQLNRYGRLVVEATGVHDGDRFVLSRRAGRSWLVDTRPEPNDFPELTEATFARMICQARKAPGGNRTIEAIHMTHAAPAHSAEYDRVFQVPVVFESDVNALMLAEGDWLNQAATHPVPYVFGILSERANALMKALDTDQTTRGRVESLLLPELHTGRIGMTIIADRMAISRQTLFRCLRAENTTYERVLNELRHKLALSYLSDRQVSINETAYLVGFSEAAAFSRAFKRWTGANPREMRRLSLS